MTIRTLHHLEEMAGLGDDWARMVQADGPDILGQDFTSTLDWVSTIWRLHLDGQPGRVLVLEDGDTITGILPLYRSVTRLAGLGLRMLAPINEVHTGGRGFLVEDGSRARIEELLDHLSRDRSWDLFAITVVEDSPCALALAQILASRRWPARNIATTVTPYIIMDGSWDTYLASLPKKFRWLLRNSEKRAREKGRLEYTEFTSADDADRFVDAVFEIERESWKESEGSSITTSEEQSRFYREFAAVACANRWFSGHLLELDGEPIAYIYGIIHGGVFSDLKESYKLAYRDLSPGHILKVHAFQRLFERPVSFYDFQGLCEDYKLRWAKNTYSRTTLLLYNGTLKARAAWLGHRLSARLRGDNTSEHATAIS